MRALALLPLAALVACSSTTSGLTIAPRSQFVLGGDESGRFVVDLVNKGEAPVEVAEVTRHGDTLAVATLSPADSTRARFAAGSAALLANRSDRVAHVRAVIRGDTDLGMRSVPVD